MPLLSSLARRIAIVCLTGLVMAGEARAAEGDPAEQRESAAADRQAEAVRAFDQANTHYDLGEYDQAIPLFRRAYEISRAPALIFNIAQAYRLGGDCHRALEAYRQFLRMASDAGLRATAERHSESLRRSCRPVAAGEVSRPVPPPVPAPPPASRWRPLGLASMGAGVLSGAAATVLYLRNNTRYDRWKTEDRRLSSPQNGLDAMEMYRRQDVNDQLWRSIKQTDRLVMGLAVTGAVLTMGGGLYWFLSRPPERMSVSFSFTGTAVGATVRWR
jgi:tetratricopeptide (TPR) repeat protein